MNPIHEDNCPSCGAARPRRFCAECGERRVDAAEFGVGHFLRSVVGGLTDLDGRVLGSLRTLLTRPGKLTAEWARGNRVPYLRPVQVFLLINVVAILVSVSLDLQSWLLVDGATGMEWSRSARAEQALRLGLETAEYDELYAIKNAGLAKATVFVMLPVAALISWLLHYRRERRAGVHLTYACHFAAFYLAVPDLLFHVLSKRPLQWLVTHGGDYSQGGSLVRFFVPMLLAGWWWARAERRAFGKPPWAARWRALVAAPLFLMGGKIVHQAIVLKLTLWLIER